MSGQEDYVLVPREPTEEMFNAAISWFPSSREIWRRMIAAAPASPPPQPSGDGLSDETLRQMIKDGYEAEADRIGYDPFIDFARAVEARVRSQRGSNDQ